MEWFKWFGRWGERDKALARLAQLKEAYGAHGDRVIRLSARTDLARKSAGSTKKAFEFVDRTFADATGDYAKVMDMLEAIEAGLRQGKVGDLAAVDRAIKAIGPKLDELERHLATWEAKWSQVPHEIDEAARALANLKVQVEQAVAAVGAPLPLSDRMASMEQHLERTRQALAEGNPVEAGYLAGDLTLAIQKVAGDVASYVSGASAITGAERDIAQVRERLAAAGDRPDAATAIADAEAAFSRLRPSLAAGRLDQFQADLLTLQRALSTARTALK